MNLDRPKSFGKTVEVKASNRPIKIAYVVPYVESPINHTIIDAVFYESYTRWAGAYTLIIPSDSKNFLDPAYEAWLEFFDPDFVYTYVALDEDLIKNIDRLCSPIALLQHEIRERNSNDPGKRAFLPKWNSYFTAVSSMTTIPSPHVHYPSYMRREPEGEIMIVTQYGSESIYRPLSDNFGTAFDVHTVTHAIPGFFRTLCLAPPSLPHNIVVGTKRCTSITDVLSAFNSRKALPIAWCAMVHSEAIPRAAPHEWVHSFNLFIGKTLIDRIHFWNARHFTQSGALIGALILEKNLFEDTDFVTQLGNYLNNHNFLRPGSGRFEVSMRSYSHSKEELISIQDELQRHTHNCVFVKENFNTPPIPKENEYERNYYSRLTDSSTYKLTEDINTLQAKDPSHFAYIPPRHKGLAKGQWIVELDIERHNNLSKYNNVIDRWVLPRRSKIVPAFTNNLGKVTLGHRLALLPTTEDFPFGQSMNKQHSYDLFLPEDETFFRYLVLNYFKYPKYDLRESVIKNLYKNLSISDKGQNLRGVISMFDSLSDAHGILTNKYWREVLRAGKKDSARYLVYKREQLKGFIPKDLPTRKKLLKQLNLKNIGMVLNFMENNLTDTLEHLVRANVFYQVHQWRCIYCGHINSRNFDGLKIKNSCEICSTEYYAPIDLEWAYQLNDFVYRSLIINTGLPVLWTLGFLQNKFIREGFWYLPEVDLYEQNDEQEDKQKNKNEIDILCIIDGTFYAVEAKLSAFLFVNDPGEADKFIRKINLIQPDIAILSFEQYCELEEDVVTTKATLHKISDDIKEGIGSFIELEIIVAHDIEAFNDYTADLVSR